ncbi:phospholipase C [Paraburkholderia lycopersici]|uniref:Phospholipase C n=1 Tax=Paraburkholderia lycopersici TaxID=416944 RepID=A0A1G7ARA9_9BURK|nr:alkaline phosphatase family protein [Paraburkholderia lycopersici]SDE17434.1 phospholipase C [Paraburkholderia lycopersici]
MQWRHIAAGSLAAAAFASTVAWSAGDDHDKSGPHEIRTATPIKHLVVIYGENVSFDHYFATYPHAGNPSGEPAFHAQPGTPEVNGLSGALLTKNPNFTNAANGAGAANPFRLDRTQAATADQNHAYTAEEQAYDNGAADLFPKYTGNGTSGGAGAFGTTGQVMGYYDGNTVTALWNYAQRFAMSDNAYTSTYGPSTPGALEVVSGQTNGMKVVLTTRQPSTAGSYYVNDGQGGFTMINDVDPAYDSCSSTTDTAMMSGKNIGDLLNARNISWGGFMGGFNLTTVNGNGTTGCKRSTLSTVVGAATADYIPHHNWFQYYASTSNPKHLRPSSLAAIGHSVGRDGNPDPANHQYDSDDFFNAVKAGNFPAVSFLKAPAYQDGHAGYSDPLDEQAFVAKVVNFLQEQRDWDDTAVIVAWDDSDGWYDHAYALPTSASYDAVADQLTAPGICGTGSARDGLNGKPVNGRCGPGTRIPFVVISPWAKENYVDHTQIDQASVVRFIEDNWLDGKRIGGGSFDASAGSITGMFDFDRRGKGHNDRKLFLDPATGVALDKAPKI